MLAALHYALSLTLAGLLLVSASAVSEGERALSRMESAEEKTDTMVKSWLEDLSFGLYSGASEKAQARARVEAAAGYHRGRVNLCAWALMCLTVLFLARLAIDWRRHVTNAQDRFVLHLHGVAGVCLLVGLFAPMLTIVAQREVAVLGRVVLQFESKSILSTVFSLFTAGSTFTAGLLFLFSVVVPVAKLGVSLLALKARSPGARDICVRFLRMVGKWSMTDVFVVAVLLAFLATGEGKHTDARLGPGLYFFAVYGLLSMAGGLLLARTVAGTREPPSRPEVPTA